MPRPIKLNKSNRYYLYFGDCFDLLSSLPSESVDLVVTSPPYCMGKAYEKSRSVRDFIEMHRNILPEIHRVTKLGGSICWQVGYHVKNAEVVPLDYFVYEIFSQSQDLFLRNRIVWTYGHGFHCKKRFSGRHEIILWFTKGKKYIFDLDAVRVPQKYPGKKYYKGPQKGNYSGNPLGKNPSDIWEIPNVKSNHVEKTAHPCQYPVALVQRLVKALTRKNDVILDPFMGSGSTGVAALVENRFFYGAEINAEYFKIAEERLKNAMEGKTPYREDGTPIYVPNGTESVAKKPANFKW